MEKWPLIFRTQCHELCVYATNMLKIIQFKWRNAQFAMQNINIPENISRKLDFPLEHNICVCRLLWTGFNVVPIWHFTIWRILRIHSPCAEYSELQNTSSISIAIWIGWSVINEKTSTRANSLFFYLDLFAIEISLIAQICQTVLKCNASVFFSFIQISLDIFVCVRVIVIIE